MITIHPTYKKTAEGFIPMLTVRGDKGRMIGAVTPKGEVREWRTFKSKAAAVMDAYSIAFRASQNQPDCIKVA